MATTPSLNVLPRNMFGKKVKHLRKRKRIPGILYGYKMKNQPVECNEQEFHKVFLQAGESTVVDLEINDKKVPVLIHQIALDPVSGSYAHVDFLALDLTKEVSTRVPLRIIGEAPGVKELGGVLVHHRETLTVRCLPKDLPHVIDVGVSNLKNFHDAVTVAALHLPPNVKIEEKPDEILVSLQPPRKEEEELPPPTPEAVAAEAVAEGAAAPTEGTASAEKEAAEGKGEKKGETKKEK